MNLLCISQDAASTHSLVTMLLAMPWSIPAALVAAGVLYGLVKGYAIFRDAARFDLEGMHLDDLDV